ncbi:MAG TPA: CoA-binding protein [Chitinophagales bacterium]|nr:CoA-binding protein [Chitinophagales bacterium]HNL84026.1 CoA-binding protein [Chitinophagales bacterium]
MNKKTVVIGASPKPDRYSYKAVKMLEQHGHDVIACGFEPNFIGDIPIVTEWKNYHQVDTVSLYLNPKRQKEYYEYILSLKPKRVIFNPGTENEELFILCKQHHILPVEACTLVLLSTHQF